MCVCVCVCVSVYSAYYTQVCYWKETKGGTIYCIRIFSVTRSRVFLGKSVEGRKRGLRALCEKKVYGRKVRRNNQVTYFSVFATLEILTTWKTGGSLQEANYQSSIEIPRALIPESRFFSPNHHAYFFVYSFPRTRDRNAKVLICLSSRNFNRRDRGGKGGMYSGARSRMEWRDLAKSKQILLVFEACNSSDNAIPLSHSKCI